jgi:hypothetical protein
MPVINAMEQALVSCCDVLLIPVNSYLIPAFVVSGERKRQCVRCPAVLHLVAVAYHQSANDVCAPHFLPPG